MQKSLYYNTTWGNSLNHKSLCSGLYTSIKINSQKMLVMQKKRYPCYAFIQCILFWATKTYLFKKAAITFYFQLWTNNPGIK